MEDSREEYEQAKQSCPLRLLSHLLTGLSYACFVLFFPVTFFLCVKRLREEERLVVFRLGKMIGARGPGRVLIFPWLDRTVKAVVSDSAFSVPPQQLITNDGGIIEIGAEVQYGITDVVVMVREVADHQANNIHMADQHWERPKRWAFPGIVVRLRLQDILRSLGKTVMVRMLAKKHISKLTREKTACASEITKELNKQIRKWGLVIRCVSLSEIKVLKQPEAMPGMGPLLKGLGLGKGKPVQLGGPGPEGPKPFPSPMEFARTAAAAGGLAAAEGGDQGTELSVAVQRAEAGESDWRSCIETVINQEQSLDQQVFGVYSVCVTDRNESIVIELGEKGRVVRAAGEAETAPDVSVNISSSDLAGVLKGSLPPLQAYLTGRISTQGDVRKLMLFDKLSNRAHKPGATFSL